jgi:serine-type D-Ala-D-Ala carboxypeptidase/endopeptidase (penicillin-binding protein 4)
MRSSPVTHTRNLIRSRIIWLLLLLLLGCPAQASDLDARIDAALLRLGPHATSGVRVLAADSGAVVYERHPDLSLNPASTMKLFTSGVALARLGPEYRFSTRVLLQGTLQQQGDLDGDLVLQGGGDPVLETPDLERLADAVRDSGLRRVRGDLLADDYRYDDQRLGFGWGAGDEPFYYSAQISALSVNRNVVRVDARPGAAAGDPVRVAVRPVPEYVVVETSARTAPAGAENTLRITRARARNVILVRGELPLDADALLDRPVTVEEPPLYTAALFRRLLRERGVRIDGGDRRAPVPVGSRELAVHTSPTLAEMLPLLNKPSDNLMAEMLLKEVGFAAKAAGTSAAGSAVLVEWLGEIGIDTGGLRLNDGSGLTRLSLLTARALTDLLLHANQAPWREVFLASLPIAGVDGTLRNRLAETAAAGNVRAKTGSLTHVTSLGGYVTTAAGERLLFGILINNFPGPNTGPMGAKRIEDLIAVALAESDDQRSEQSERSDWSDRSDRSEQSDRSEPVPALL